MKILHKRKNNHIAIIEKASCSIIEKIDISAYNEEYIGKITKSKRKEYSSKDYKVIKV